MKAVDGKILLTGVEQRGISKVDCALPILAHQLANPGNIVDIQQNDPDCSPSLPGFNP
ncbi:MAG TPA: hypothetical protein VKB48_04130 [Candidatus Acidoferrum sp.]|nr:hypothetical protein [Candidatus Acidoferrum sp.]